MVFSRLDHPLTRTTIYVDGYNLYYARLKGTPYKWLDLVALFRDRILRAQDPNAQVVALKYFTAPVMARYARHGAESTNAQTQYHRALESGSSGLVEIIKGFHIFEPTHLPTFTENAPPNKRLTELAHWVRRHIRDDELVQSQLARNVPTKRKPASKPAHW